MDLRKPLTRQVYEGIYTAVVDGRLQPGDIITEKQLTEQYGVSKSPIREALITLCDEGVIENIPRVGYRVLMIRMEELQQLIDARMALELMLFDQCFPFMTREDFAELRALDDQNRKLDLTRASERWRHNISFHLKLASKSRNRYLLSFLERVLRASARASTFYYQYKEPPDYNAELSIHQQFLNACERRDYRQARMLLQSDIQRIMSREVE